MPLNVDSINTGSLSVNGNPIGNYKVYTALLTQNGTDTESSINSGSLTIGVTYTVNQNSPGMDFTNVGAPNNNLGTRFVATGTIPNSWGNGATYTLAYSEGAPVVTVLENTIGNIWFTYNSVGYYTVNSSGLFTNNKSVIFISNSTNDTADPTQIVNTRTYDIESMYIQTFASGDPSNSILLNTPIEIRVYN